MIGNYTLPSLTLKGKHGVQFDPDIIELFIVLFADNVVILSFTRTGLHHQLNLLANNADYLDLIVNLENRYIVVFKNGGYLVSRNGYEVKHVNSYHYFWCVAE